jgi:hypothetical protein
MTQQPNAIQKLINFLDKGFVYIYRPVDEQETRSWLQTNTEHMDYLLNKYNKRLETCDLQKVTAQIIINGQLRHETAAYNHRAIIQYFRDNKADFTNYEEKIVRIRYVFGNSVTPDRVTQEELIKTASEYDICYRYLPINEDKDKKKHRYTSWMNQNINFLRDLLSSNQKTLVDCRYGITVEINGETRHAWSSEECESIVSYLRECDDYSNEITEPVIITIKYVTFRM